MRLNGNRVLVAGGQAKKGTKPVGRGGRPTREDARLKGLRILDMAAAIFARDGYTGTSIDRIAEAAHVGKPTIYARYGSKADLLKSVIQHVLDNHLADIGEEGLSQPMDVGLTVILTNIIAASTEPVFLGVFRLFLSDAIKFEEIFEAFRATMENQTKKRLITYIARHPERTQLTGSVEEVAETLLESASAIVMMASTRPGFREALFAEAEASRIVRTLLYGFVRRD
ncbi:TetR/AcrR family transcriptional regulator [Sphingobium estronivorans]|uniref:TetR/AcrR family transcriptional regulator n=1 Tax=Sphingobium estronivorans TaxID=1577690 RepID=UPI00123A6530|nr:TetR/AcrR family transcriptional regulator [Sphingobium estronivorans]